ncbi:MAG TPA: CarD family transcriptional regulator [Firmicutes bacterium]|jgi:CarD family transcriptional regulator|nr:CarD family transcriptional regulator [Bacillota bacterium]HBK68655.1 CarD family transcriptional regulator [Bacillota bacterium]HBT15351.1 CarD family transcriptional regulator [Bacillota bacterium]
MFNVGDRIVYPMHGAGVIEGIEQKNLSGIPEDYYIIKLTSGEMKVMIPVCNKDLVGLREIISKDEVSKVLEVLKNRETEMSANWNRRYRANLEKIKTGSIYYVAEVVSGLTIRDKEKGLSTGERKMLENAKQILLSELALAQNMDEQQVQTIVEGCLN